MAAATAWIGSTVIGAIIGGNKGKARMEREYQEAQAYVAQHGEFRGKGQAVSLAPEKAPERAYTITPEQAALLETKLAEAQINRGAHVHPGMVAPAR